MTGQAIVGWDVGGAHLKAARISVNGNLEGTWQEPCPLWRGLEELDRAISALANHAEADCHAVTMTGEMTDLFATRQEGVCALAEFMSRRLAPARVLFYAGTEGWVAGNDVKACSDAIASANWHASARLLSTGINEALLVDIGSTTTDIIPVCNGRVATASRTDADRLTAGELLYTGVVRTPVMALADEAPVAGQWLTLMAEHFATSADVYRILGWLPARADSHDSADGGPKTNAASRSRLARMVGRDAHELPDEAWTGLASWLAQCQLQRIERSARQVLSRVLLDAQSPIVMAGVGSFLGARLSARLDRPLGDFHQILPHSGPEYGWYAPAVAVAKLMLEDCVCA